MPLPYLVCVAATLLVFVSSASAQREWTLLSGSNTPMAPPVFGELDVPSVNVHPGARGWGTGAYDPVNREVWIFGGWIAIDTAGSTDEIMNDLWRYRLSDSTWTWMSGANTTRAPGFYSPVGVSDPRNVPSARGDTCMWIDVQHRELWLQGGTTSGGTLSDIWMYSLVDFTWTLMGGSNVTGHKGIYGVKGVASTEYLPGSRVDHTCWFDPQTSRAYIYGGYDACNDIWMFDRSDRTWTWLYGENCSALSTNQERSVPTVYGPVGVPMSGIGPGAAASVVPLFSAQKRMVFLYGGDGAANRTEFQRLVNLWAFHLDTLQWTFLGGSNETTVEIAIYGEKGVPSITNSPGGRYDSGGWVDDVEGAIYLWGSVGELKSNDMWRLGDDNQIWTWVAGENQTDAGVPILGQFEAVGVSSLTAYPSGRTGHVVMYDLTGTSVFIYAGSAWSNDSTIQYVGDLWHYNYRDAIPGPPQLAPQQAPQAAPTPTSSPVIQAPVAGGPTPVAGGLAPALSPTGGISPAAKPAAPSARTSRAHSQALFSAVLLSLPALLIAFLSMP